MGLINFKWGLNLKKILEPILEQSEAPDVASTPYQVAGNS
jgi:hypothetical protein